MRSLGVFLAVAAAASLAGCAGEPTVPVAVAPTAQPTALPSKYSVDRLIGSWGIASYRNDKDRARTETQAKAQCKNAYKIAKGPTDGVIMHVADDATPHELTLKGGPDGKTYLGFAGPPGDDQDRVVLSLTENMFVVKYIDADTNTRYGTLIYVRCPAGKA